jgi:uncharacterized protein (TIGR00730 family)
VEQLKSVCVFCGSSSGTRPEFAAAASALGSALAAGGTTLVFGGGRVGLMGVAADAVLAAGGRAVGVMPRHLIDREIAHTGLTELHVVESMHERKQLMADLADAFVMLPGGFGTWDEFCEVVTWSQLGLHRKPCGILDVAEYYAPFIALADGAVANGFVRPAHRNMLVIERDVEVLLTRLSAAAVPSQPKWIGGATPVTR